MINPFRTNAIFHKATYNCQDGPLHAFRGRSIACIQGSLVTIKKLFISLKFLISLKYIYISEDRFLLANRADPNEMLYYAAFFFGGGYSLFVKVPVY